MSLFICKINYLFLYKWILCNLSFSYAYIGYHIIKNSVTTYTKFRSLKEIKFTISDIDTFSVAWCGAFG